MYMFAYASVCRYFTDFVTFSSVKCCDLPVLYIYIYNLFSLTVLVLLILKIYLFAKHFHCPVFVSDKCV
jgi:hypothetical protein